MPAASTKSLAFLILGLRVPVFFTPIDLPQFPFCPAVTPRSPSKKRLLLRFGWLPSTQMDRDFDHYPPPPPRRPANAGAAFAHDFLSPLENGFTRGHTLFLKNAEFERMFFLQDSVFLFLPLASSVFAAMPPGDNNATTPPRNSFTSKLYPQGDCALFS